MVNWHLKIMNKIKYNVSESRSGLYHANFADNQMDELNLEKAYSIDYYKRMFYPEVPCKQCEYCWRNGY